MAEYTIYHNPKCSTSRAGLKLLQDAGVEVKVVNYMTEPPSERTMMALLKKLKLPAEALLRKKEPIYKTLPTKRNRTDEQWVNVMREHPHLIERPIVAKGRKAVIGRPLENITDLLG